MNATDIKAAVVTSMRAEYDAKLVEARKADPEYSRLLKTWKDSDEDGSYSSPEFLALDAKEQEISALVLA